MYIKHLSEPWFSLIKLGIKKVEGRLNKGDFANMKKGDIIQFVNNDNHYREFKIKITSIHHYNNFESYLLSESLELCLPGIDTIDEGVSIYHKYYPIDEVEKFGIIAVRFKRIK